MIGAYRAGVPGNGQPFPDGSKIAKIEWKPKKRYGGPLFSEDPRRLARRVFDREGSQEIPGHERLGIRRFLYDPTSDTFKPDGSPVNCGYACHTIVAKKDYIFTDYGKR